MLAKDGLAIIGGTAVIFLISLGMWYLVPNTVTGVTMVVFGLLAVFNLFFFRDPHRKIPRNPFAVLSPADGRVTNIVKLVEPDYFNHEVQRISIFLSIFNVHVNRTPLSGTVDYFAYHTGKFFAAFKEKASIENEQTVIGMVDQYGHRVLFKQIAGVLARRIICHLREGQWSNAGERMGMICYGSRVDVFVPLEAKIQVVVGQRVKGGETILALFPEEGDEATTEETVLEVPKTEVT